MKTRHGLEQGPGVGMTRGLEKIGHIGHFAKVAGIHDADPVAGFGHHPQVVGDEQDRCNFRLPQAAHQVQDLGLNGDIEVGGGLIGNQQQRAAGQGHGDHDALFHPPREVVGIKPDHFFGVGNAQFADDVHRPSQGLRLQAFLPTPHQGQTCGQGHQGIACAHRRPAVKHPLKAARGPAAGPSGGFSACRTVAHISFLRWRRKLSATCSPMFIMGFRAALGS